MRFMYGGEPSIPGLNTTIGNSDDRPTFEYWEKGNFSEFSVAHQRLLWENLHVDTYRIPGTDYEITDLDRIESGA